MTEIELINLAENIINNLKSKKLTLGLAESCTGGWLSKIITDVSGASAVYNGGICSYSNLVKINLLGVRAQTLDTYGAVSEQTAREMAEGARKALKSDIGIGITGIAGPLSDNTLKEVGLIYVAISYKDNTTVTQLNNKFKDNIRLNNRLSAVETALSLLGGINE
ncbi:MAG: CinA family protein [Clostridia bacterium]|nr:CinA family protein [Clostridia bacterium]